MDLTPSEIADTADRLADNALQLRGSLPPDTTDAVRSNAWARDAYALASLAADAAGGALASAIFASDMASIHWAVNEIRSAAANVQNGFGAAEVPQALGKLAETFQGIARRSAPARAAPLAPGAARVVWVLGAGFSKPLGGPLLGQLLSPSSFLNLRERYGRSHAATSAAAVWACHVYHYGRAYADGRIEEPMATRNVRGEALWDDAEVFIDLLDSAVQHNSARKTIERVVQVVGTAFAHAIPADGSQVEQMREAARRLVAAECNAFVVDASLAQERWSAHISWAKQLNGRHTLITFNYDRALERLRGHLREELRMPSAGPTAILPDQDPATAEFAGQAIALKLHGSVDWCQSESGIERATDREFALTAASQAMVIATPGPTKTEVTRDLEPLWRRADDRLKEADAVVFVGYRFPPTDSLARMRILKAIEERARSGNGRPLGLHVVLGPRSADAPRLAELLRHAARRGGLREDTGPGPIRSNSYRLRVHELYSQDFFTVYDEAMILP